MSRKAFIPVFAVLLGGAGFLAIGSHAAQFGTAGPAEPEFNFVAFSLDANGALVPLERQQGNIQTKVKALGFSGANAATLFSGDKSPVRFKSGQNMQSVIRLTDQGTDPSTLVNLADLSVAKGKRELVTVKVGAMGLHTNSGTGKPASSLQFAKYGEHSYRFSPSGDLPPGEYLITTGGSREGFLFGID